MLIINIKLPIVGLASFSTAAALLILGKDSPALKESRVFNCQSLSGTGALRIGAECKSFPIIITNHLVLHRFHNAPVYISDPTWGNHWSIFGDCGFKVLPYTYYDAPTKGVSPAFFECLESAEEKSIFVLHVCAHNPTGVDPSNAQWQKIAEIMKRRNVSG